jgi:hypothetical protein
MLATVMMLRRYVPSADNPATPNFWFVMSMGLLVGFLVAYPINWWLVANHLKHGMMTVRPARADAGAHRMIGILHYRRLNYRPFPKEHARDRVWAAMHTKQA